MIYLIFKNAFSYTNFVHNLNVKYVKCDKIIPSDKIIIHLTVKWHQFK